MERRTVLGMLGAAIVPWKKQVEETPVDLVTYKSDPRMYMTFLMCWFDDDGNTKQEAYLDKGEAWIYEGNKPRRLATKDERWEMGLDREIEYY